MNHNENSPPSSISAEKSYFRWLWDTLFEVHPYPLFIMLNFTITFLLFINIGFSPKTSLSALWSILIFNLSYNIGDFLGKLLGDFRSTFNSMSITYLLGARLFFFYNFIVLSKPSLTENDILIDNSIFPYFDMLLFGLTNGFVTNGSFILSFETAKGDYKKYAGVLGGILLQIGIMMGTFLAIPLGLIVNPGE